jgi:hypothetical protein
MNRTRIKRKQAEVVNHRYWQLDKAIDGLFDGTHTPEYVKDRADKLKLVAPKRNYR